MRTRVFAGVTTGAVSRALGSLACAALFLVAPLQAQDLDRPFRRHFVGTSAFVLANLLPDPPDFYQLNYGYWLSRRDIVSIEAITWKYDAPLGIPYGPSFDSPEEEYPGHVRAHGLGVAYQRLLWRDFYSGVHVASMRQRYFDESDVGIQNGFQLFLVLRFGYHVRLLHDRLFLEPSVAFTHWPVNTNAPPAFAEKDRKWPSYFLFEPGFHVGRKF